MDVRHVLDPDAVAELVAIAITEPPVADVLARDLRSLKPRIVVSPASPP